jgi:ubiquinone/menaquinone biosynthesis C-methylase UbiE
MPTLPTGPVLDESPAHAYEEFFVPAMFGPLADRTLRIAGLRPGEAVLDLACGTGVVARRAADAVGPSGSVVGVDVNPVMLEQARTLPGAAAVDWRQGDAVSVDLPASFDAALCQQGLQFFPDRPAGARTLRAALRDGGRAVVACWRGIEENPFISRLADIELPHLQALGSGFTGADLELPFSMRDGQLRQLLEDAGFAEVELTTVTIDARFATPDRFIERLERAYAAVVPAFLADPRAFQDYVSDVARESRDLVEQHRQGDHVLIPLRCDIALART